MMSFRFRRWGIPALIVLGLVEFNGCKNIPKDQAHFEKGYNAYFQGDYYTALLYLKPLVENGNPAAQLLMARMHAFGQGVQEDELQAEYLWNQAAATIRVKDPNAIGNHAVNYTLKTAENRLEALIDPKSDLKSSLSSEDFKAIHDLGVPAESGQTAEESTRNEDHSLLPSAEDVKSVLSLSGRSHQSGPIRSVDELSASSLQQSAKWGNPLAMRLLAEAYEKGNYGLSPNHRLSSSWARAAQKAQGHKVGSEFSQEPWEQIPYVQLGWTLLGGLTLIGLGWDRLRKPRRSI